MTNGYADLHLHTVASDGTQEIATLVQRAKARGLSTIAITDHDTISQDLHTRVTEIAGMEVITGVELKVEFDGMLGELLGYFVDPFFASMQELFVFMRRAREQRMAQMVSKCRNCLGIDISLAEVRALAHVSIGRPHLAQVLVEKGAAETMRDAFDRLIGNGGTCYVPLERPGFRQATDAIHAAGGVAAVPHPCFLPVSDWPAFLGVLRAADVDGIEAFYPYVHDDARLHINPDVLRSLAEENGFLLTGGSDDHGPASVKEALGEVRLPYKYVEEIKRRCGLSQPACA